MLFRRRLATYPKKDFFRDDVCMMDRLIDGSGEGLLYFLTFVKAAVGARAVCLEEHFLANPNGSDVFYCPFTDLYNAVFSD